jgi:hypothetical protein
LLGTSEIAACRRPMPVREHDRLRPGGRPSLLLASAVSASGHAHDAAASVHESVCRHLHERCEICQAFVSWLTTSTAMGKFRPSRLFLSR